MRFVSIVPAANPRRHVMLGIGASEGTVEILCVLSLYGASSLLRAAGVSVSLCIEAGNCHVDDMRNGIAAEFLASDCDELIFIDEDVGFRPEDLLRLVLHDRDVVGGVYPKKQDDEDFPIYVEPGTELWSDADGLVEVEGLPTGFLKIRRKVVEELAKDALTFTGTDGVDYKVLFERTVCDGRRWSGDYAFCRKWRAKGGKLYVDPWFVLSHTGRKTWVGTLGDYWLRVNGVTQARFEEGMDALVAGHPTFEHFVNIARGWGNIWSASPELLEAVWNNAHGRALECGTGLTTLVLAARGCDVTSLEHDPLYAAQTRAMLDRYGLKAKILCAPLKDGWYNFPGGNYDTLVVDGPPRALGDRRTVLDWVTAKTILWDDYAGGLDNPEIIEGQNRFAIERQAA